MDIGAFRAAVQRLGPLAHLATVAADGCPHVVPIHAEWHDGHFYVMAGSTDAKTRNLRREPRVCMHFQVAKETNWDGLIIWGTAQVLDDVVDKRRLWSGVFSYDLDLFSPGGPDASPDSVFLEITADRAVLLLNYGLDGREEWLPD